MTFFGGSADSSYSYKCFWGCVCKLCTPAFKWFLSSHALFLLLQIRLGRCWQIAVFISGCRLLVGFRSDLGLLGAQKWREHNPTIHLVIYTLPIFCTESFHCECDFMLSNALVPPQWSLVLQRWLSLWLFAPSLLSSAYVRAGALGLFWGSVRRMS